MNMHERIVAEIERIKTSISFIAKHASPDWDPPHMVFGIDKEGKVRSPPDLALHGREDLREAAQSLAGIREPNTPEAVGVVFAGFVLDPETKMRIGECITISAESKDKKCYFASAAVERHENAPATIHWGSVAADGKVGGFLSGFYP